MKEIVKEKKNMFGVKNDGEFHMPPQTFQIRLRYNIFCRLFIAYSIKNKSVQNY